MQQYCSEDTWRGLSPYDAPGTIENAVNALGSLTFLPTSGGRQQDSIIISMLQIRMLRLPRVQVRELSSSAIT